MTPAEEANRRVDTVVRVVFGTIAGIALGFILVTLTSFAAWMLGLIR